ncbi:hypothetical protein E6W39_22410 [Kitasatospora acidiphila]|uniref:Uncharacterized protein n=1 Tax=Kitasatospora acidiphila TaxID=2567942 RepID=A0A540W632_9ACTN|nr:hypothetical protein [Kitasatospora acidiphila]TQF04476.1 hypothetical protein E6W39_22410 [Kitasatospora acidiphila]
MAEQTPRVVNVVVRPISGYELEIEGADGYPQVAEDDFDRHREEAVSDAVREALGIPEDVPLNLTITEE